MSDSNTEKSLNIFSSRSNPSLPVVSSLVSSSSSSPSSPRIRSNMMNIKPGQNNFKLLLLVGMVLQNSSVVLVGRYTRSAVPKSELYSVNHLIFVVEAMKFVFSAALEYRNTNGQLVESIQRHVLRRPMDALKISIPALLYLTQNTLLYVALSNLTAPLFQVTYQCKLVTTAIVSGVLLNRKYKLQQWVCLIVLSMGVAIVVLGEHKADDDNKNDNDPAKQSLFVGLCAVFVACFCSAFAGVYFEKVIKRPTGGENDSNEKNAAPASVWMRNMQLAFYSLVIAYVQGLLEKQKADISDMSHKDYFYGFTVYVWVVVWLQAGGGLLVAAVIKYADNVLKGLATGVSIVAATTFSILFLGTELSFQFFIGACMILGSVYVFSNPITFANQTNQNNNQNTVLPR